MKKVFIPAGIVLFLLFAADISAEPIIMPVNSGGLEVVTLGEAREINLIWEYHAAGIKELSQEFFNELVLFIPVPASNEHQTVSVNEIENAEIVGFTQDLWGNPVLAVKLKSVPEEDIVKLYMSVSILPTAYYETVDYYYQLEGPSHIFANGAGRILVEDAAVSGVSVRETAGRYFLGKIYDPAEIELYPVSDQQYLDGALAAASSLLTKHNLPSWFCSGLLVPVGTDFLMPDFLLMVLNPHRSLSGFTSGGQPFVNDGTWLSLFYSPDKLYFPGYVSYHTAHEAGFLSGNVLISAEKRAVVLSLELSEPNVLHDEFFLDLGSTAQRTFFLAGRERRYYSTAESVEIATVELAEDYADGSAVNPKEKFSPHEKVTAVIRFRQRKAGREVECRWIMPDGTEYYRYSITPGAGWELFYTHINGNNQIIRKGLWRLETYVNGKLENRSHFIVQ